ncbi:hypothetical protein [Variovorax sp.]|uniref:hypothetical protein n=1 Tax=Variovorax sp. TaxID=1871043 RepID=UPI002D3F98DD|nr:hypothetical protein [Variovorax sp.]HYP86069.1 hypothetical protein [Variovorax sp.]
MSLLTVDLYQSATDPDKFLAVPTGVDPAEIMGPMTFDKDYLEVVQYRKGFEFDPGGSYAGANAAKIAADILTIRWAMYQRGGAPA